jgi:glycosyltransferase involved in cell wall biosynthesis
MSPSFSVALATCNGAHYLPGLLDSLAAQQLTPSELVVSDDASDDDTPGILEHFAKCTPFPVNVMHNPSRLGVEENFARALAACNGDYIALADQDDVWRLDKLRRLAQALDAPDTIAVFSNAEVVAGNLETLGYSMWQRVNFTRREQNRMTHGNGFEVLLKHRVVTGATFACQASLIEAALPIPPGWAHDAWFALIAASQGKLAAIPESLIAYRQHEGNVVGGTRRPLRQEARNALKLDRSSWYKDELRLWHTLQDRLEALSVTLAARTALSAKIAHLEARANLPATRWLRLPAVLREIATRRYARYARNWGSVALDLLVK